jgi:hypothetical protein
MNTILLFRLYEVQFSFKLLIVFSGNLNFIRKSETISCTKQGLLPWVRNTYLLQSQSASASENESSHAATCKVTAYLESRLRQLALNSSSIRLKTAVTRLFSTSHQYTNVLAS